MTIKKNEIIIVFLFLISLSICAEDNTPIETRRDIQDLSTILTGGLIASESSLMIVDFDYINKSIWNNLKNNGIAISDIVLGSILVYYGLSGTDYSKAWFYYSVLATLVMTHSIREYEYIAKSTNPYDESLPLFIFNNIRLGLLGTSFFLSIKE